jgi:hypothetical protein
LISDFPRPSKNPTPTPPVDSHVVDSMIGTFHTKTQSKQAILSNPKYTTSKLQNTPPLTPSLGKTFEVNSVQSTPTGKNQNKKKGKGKNKEKKNNNQQSDIPKTHPAKYKEKRKPRYPCLIYGEDHYTKDCP